MRFRLKGSAQGGRRYSEAEFAARLITKREQQQILASADRMA